MNRPPFPSLPLRRSIPCGGALLLWIILCSSPFGACHAQSSRIEQADRLFASGDGQGAIELYRAVISECTASVEPAPASKEAHHSALTGAIRVALRYGEQETAERTLAHGLEVFPESPPLLTLAGNYASSRGKLEDAVAYWQKAVLADPDQAFEARFRMIEANESLSPLPDREEPYRWFIDRYEKGEVKDRALLPWVGRSYVKIEKYEWDGAQKVYQEILEASPAHEEGLIAKGDLWLDRYDEGTAIEIYEQVLRGNPESLPALWGIAQANMDMGNLAGGKKAVDRILFLNPKEPNALSVLADIHFYNEEEDQAKQCLESGYETDPVSLPLLSIETAYSAKQLDWDRAEEIEKKTAQTYANRADYHFRIAKCLERNYLFSLADKYYLKCLEDHPGEKRAIAGRAILRSRISPASAETALEPMREAFKKDPFHVRLFNMRNLFEKREGFELAESEHFKVRFPKGRKRIYGAVALEELEKDFAEFLQLGYYRPEDKILAEFYEDSNDFSMRISGLPGGGLSGVCFGDLIILKAPEPNNPNPFNWGNTLRHELMHVFTLGVTQARISRWLTEGLSVAEEWDPGIQADPLLRRRVEQNDLIPIEELDTAFHLPSGMQTVWLAYSQAGESVQYLFRRFGKGISKELLSAYSRGGSTRYIVPEVTGVSLDEINLGIREQVAKRVGYDLDSPEPEVAHWDLESDTQEDENLPPREKALKELRALQFKKEWPAVLGKADEWLTEHAGDIPFLEAKSLSAYRAGEVRTARKTADSIIEATPESYTALMVLAWLDRDNRRWDRAVEHFLAAFRLQPRNVAPGSPLREAEDILRNERDWGRLSEILMERLAVQPTDVDGYIDLAELALEGDRPKVLEEALRQALFIDPFKVEVQILWGRSYEQEGNTAAAIERYEVAKELDPLSGKPHLALAEAHLASGSRQAALECADKALELDPTLVEARDILEGRPRF